MKDALFTAKIKARYILHFWATDHQLEIREDPFEDE